MIKAKEQSCLMGDRAPERKSILNRLTPHGRASHSCSFEDEKANGSAEFVLERKETGGHDPLAAVDAQVHLIIPGWQLQAAGPGAVAHLLQLHRHPSVEVARDLHGPCRRRAHA